MLGIITTILGIAIAIGMLSITYTKITSNTVQSYSCPPGQVPQLNPDNTQAKDSQGNPICKPLDAFGNIFGH
jgi:hypothetical protein